MASSRRASKKRKREKNKETEGVVEDFMDESDWWQELSQRLTTTGKIHTDNEDEKFKSFFRVSRKTFDYICSMVKPDLSSRPLSVIITVEGRVLTVEKQVAIALRRLASGESQHNVGESFDVGQSIVSQVTWKFVEAMEERGMHHLKWPDANEMKEIKSKFEMIQGLPNCCGAIDTTHIVMRLPSVEASNIWQDSEENYSMILQAVVDPEMRFRDILTGWPGSINDHRILKNSGFFRQCECGQKLNGSVKELEDGVQIREYIVGDGGYPLLPWLLTPYHGKDLFPSRIEFNAKHHDTRLVAERAMARLKGTWRIIDGVMWRPDKHKLPRIILVCCMLHNIIIDQGDKLCGDVLLSHHHDLGYKQQLSQFADANAQTLREQLCNYLSQKAT
jgi:hypothetical protein